ncbi:hypothetical protein RFI_31314, partial [Reticulomyxa filosa]
MYRCSDAIAPDCGCCNFCLKSSFYNVILLTVDDEDENLSSTSSPNFDTTSTSSSIGEDDHDDDDEHEEDHEDEIHRTGDHGYGTRYGLNEGAHDFVNKHRLQHFCAVNTHQISPASSAFASLSYKDKDFGNDYRHKANYPLDYYSSNEHINNYNINDSNMNEHRQQEVCKFCKHTQAQHSGVEREMFSIIQSAGAFDEDVCKYFFRQLIFGVYLIYMYTYMYIFAQVSFFFYSIFIYVSFPI